MAQKSSSFGVQCHARSISLPSRTQPDFCKIEIELNKLKTWEYSSKFSHRKSLLSTEAIQNRLIGLAELYNCVQETLESTCTQQTLCKHQHESFLEQTLEVSVQLLDLCCRTKALMSEMKEHMQDLQSALRRRGSPSSVKSNINSYISLRKNVQKDAIKSLKALRKMENKDESSCKFNEDRQLSILNNLLREVSTTTISVLRSILLFLSMPESKLRSNGWSLISKLVSTRSTASMKDQKIVNEFGCVHIILNTLQENTQTHSKIESKIDVQMVLKRLQSLDGTIEGLEGGLDCLFKRLIKNRVSLLNIITS